MAEKHYRNLNGLISKNNAIVREAYDRGYNQAKKDFQTTTTHLIPEPHEGGIQFRCEECNWSVIANYMYCPHCGRRVV